MYERLFFSRYMGKAQEPYLVVALPTGRETALAEVRPCRCGYLLDGFRLWEQRPQRLLELGGTPSAHTRGN